MDEQQQPRQNNGDAERAAKPVAPSYVGVSTEEIEAGKAMAILSYAINFIGVPFFIVPLITRDNEFSLFHAKQSFIIWLVGLAGYAVGTVLLCLGIGFILLPLVWVGVLVVNILGLVNAAKGTFEPLPLIGPWGEQMFAGIHKKSATPPSPPTPPAS